MDHDAVGQTLGAWALGACGYDEAIGVLAHLDGCAGCLAETALLSRAAELVGAAQPEPPAPGLRARTVAAAVAVRAPAAGIGAAVSGYREQIAGLLVLLDRIDRDQWSLPVPRHGTVGGLIAHLSGNDRVLLDAISHPRGPDVRPVLSAPADPIRWRLQADLLARRFAAASSSVLTRLVPLAGPGRIRRPAAEALVQRVFETWTHADDLRRVLDLPTRPPGGADLGRIVEFGLRLLPMALVRTGRQHRGRTAGLVLTGPGGGRWTVPLGAATRSGRGEPGVLIVATAVDFCTVMAGRLPPDALPCTVVGDSRLALDLLHAAATLGCD